MKTVLLAGGLGTRMREETEFRPKPMVTIGGRPILWHIMRTYAAHEINKFIVLTGYKGEAIREYFNDFAAINMDFTIVLGKNPTIKKHGTMVEEGWEVTVLDTGQETMTGGRIYRARDYIGKDTFMCTYGDGVSDIDINALYRFHKSHGKIATMTSVKPMSRFGVVDISEDYLVKGFHEKPQTESWVNAGYFVFNSEIFNYLEPDSVLEQEPLNRLSADNQLMAYKHEGFWQPMDTFRESTILNQMWNEGKAPWKKWK
jgi:glucose-1-phosphate cytidylyltransferase